MLARFGRTLINIHLTLVASEPWFAVADVVVELCLADSSILARACGTHVKNMLAVVSTVPFTANARVAVDSIQTLQCAMLARTRRTLICVFCAGCTFVTSTTLSIGQCKVL